MKRQDPAHAQSVSPPEDVWERTWGSLAAHPYAWLLGLTVAVYAQTLWFGFTYLDDDNLILNRLHLLGRWDYVRQIFQEDIFRATGGRFFYRPLLALSLLLDTRIGGGSAVVYHLTNILIHLSCAYLLYRLLTVLSRKPGRALLLTSLFTVHPALVQAVAWVPGRNDSLLGLFVVVSFLLFLRFLEGGGARYFLGHLIFLSLALLTKETAVVVPLLCVLHALGRARPPDRPGPNYAWSLLWLPVLCAWWVVRSSVLENPQAPSAGKLVMAVFDCGQFLLAYLGRLVIPLHLSTYACMSQALLWTGLGAAGLLAAAFLVLRKRDVDLVVLGGLWFLLFLVPSIAMPEDIFSQRNILEHRAYLPAMGLAIALCGVEMPAYALLSLCRGLASFGLVLAWGALAWAHGRHFGNPIAFWENAAATSPQSAFVRNNLGAMRYLAGQAEAAERQWRLAVKLNAQERLVHGNLGLVLMRRGAMEEAEREYKAEIAINPLYDHVHFNFGMLCYHQKRFAEAVRLWERTLEINPDYRDAYANLIVSYLNVRDAQKVKRYAAEAGRRGLALPEELGSALRRAGLAP